MFGILIAMAISVWTMYLTERNYRHHTWCGLHECWTPYADGNSIDVKREWIESITHPAGGGMARDIMVDCDDIEAIMDDTSLVGEGRCVARVNGRRTVVRIHGTSDADGQPRFVRHFIGDMRALQAKVHAPMPRWACRAWELYNCPCDLTKRDVQDLWELRDIFVKQNINTVPEHEVLLVP